MKFLHLISIILLLVLVSCKSEFEALRTSNQPEKVYKAANKYYDNKEYDRAIALYDIVIQFYRGRQEAEDLFFKYAYAHYNVGDYILAPTYFKNYSKIMLIIELNLLFQLHFSFLMLIMLISLFVISLISFSKLQLASF